MRSLRLPDSLKLSSKQTKLNKKGMNLHCIFSKFLLLENLWGDGEGLMLTLFSSPDAANLDLTGNVLKIQEGLWEKLEIVGIPERIMTVVIN